MIDFRPLTYFLSACEQENLGVAAKELGIAPSTLSASLKSLEQALGVTLLRKRASGISPQPAASWLFRASLPIILLEGFARRRLAAPPEAGLTFLHLDIRFRFAFGRLSKAINRAIARTAEEDPLVLVQPDWTREGDQLTGAPVSEAINFTRQSRVTLEVVPRDADLAAGEISVWSDPWVIVRRSRAEDSVSGYRPQGEAGALVAPALPAPLLEQLRAYAEIHGLAIEELEASPVALAQLLEDQPGSSFILPKSVIATRLGMTHVTVAALDPPLTTTVIGRIAAADGVGAAFLKRLREALQAPEGATVFQAELTARRIRYFNLAHHLGRVSAAARAANVAQPALSQQLDKLESSVGARLFERHSYGLAPTAAGATFARVAALLERRLEELSVGGVSVSVGDSERLSLGVLPFVNQHGNLVGRITDAALALCARHPALRLSVLEAPNGTLQQWVLRGRVGLAIVEFATPQTPRLPIGPPEDLWVIAHPSHQLLGAGPVTGLALVKLPLVLPARQFGLRQLIDNAIKLLGLTLRPRHEIDSLAMLIAFLEREAVCTILPPSAVQRELDSGDLVGRPIIEPTISRRLYAIYSGDRSLTDCEREFVGLLREGLDARPAEA